MDPYFKEIEKKLPNDLDLGAAVRAYIKGDKDCCSMIVNQKPFVHPVVTGTACTACNRITIDWDDA